MHSRSRGGGGLAVVGDAVLGAKQMMEICRGTHVVVVVAADPPDVHKATAS